jgi:hypothetical protein
MPRAAPYLFLRVQAGWNSWGPEQVCPEMNAGAAADGQNQIELHSYPQPSHRDAGFDCDGRLWHVDCS